MLKILIAACLLSTPALATDCLHYGDTVTLAGRYAAAVPVKGPGERTDVLVLDSPICVAADVVSDGVSGATSIQLHCPTNLADLGGALSLTGRLFGAHTGNGQTPVLLVCRF